MKEPKCKICGKNGHYAYQCWQKPRKLPTKSRLNAIQTKKAINYISSSKTKRKTLIKQLDDVCSKICRLSEADKIGKVSCYTCGRRYHWKDMDCGHWIKRGKFATRWELDNVRPQCHRCLTGDAVLYREDFSRIKQCDVLVGDRILARNPMSDGMMIVEVNSIDEFVDDVITVETPVGEITGTIDHMVETTDGFKSITHIGECDIVTLWKK